MALATLQEFLTECRVLLQDQVAPYRYPDIDLVQALNIALLEARRLRPEFFMDISFVPQGYTASTPSALVDIEPMYKPSFIYYMVGRAQLRDDESTQDARATVLINKFTSQLLDIRS